MPTAGTCGVMGTASTMACMTEALGMMLPGGATIPAVAADRLRHAEMAGQRAMALAREGVRPSTIMTPAAFENALRVLLAIGGSTNGIVHLAAIAGRLGSRLIWPPLTSLGDNTRPVDLKPTGQFYMDDLHRAGGMAPILRALKPLLNLDCMTVTGRSLGAEIDDLPAPFPQQVVRPLDKPVHAGGGIAFYAVILQATGQSSSNLPVRPTCWCIRGRQWF